MDIEGYGVEFNKCVPTRELRLVDIDTREVGTSGEPALMARAQQWEIIDRVNSELPSLSEGNFQPLSLDRPRPAKFL
jgi:hypothetical protein